MEVFRKRDVLVTCRDSREETEMCYLDIKKEILSILKKHKVSLIQTRGLFDWILEDIEGMSLENLL